MLLLVAPTLGATSPSYLKASIAILHTASMLVTLVAATPEEGPAPHMVVMGIDIAAALSKGGLYYYPPYCAWGLHRAMGGGILYSALPMIASLLTVVGLALPLMATAPMVMLSAACYCIFCVHAAVSTAARLLPATMNRRVLISVFFLHASVHALFQTTQAHRRVCAASRSRPTVQSAIVVPALWGCIALVHAFAVAQPPTSWEDVFTMHAAMAFAPEALGGVFVACIGMANGLLNARVTRC